MKKVILASTSVYRKKLLQQLQIEFTAQSPRNDEELQKVEFTKTYAKSPGFAYKLAEYLALEKAKSLAPQEAIIIGSDQLLSFKDEILGKPHTVENAQFILQKLSGQTADLITSVALIDGSHHIQFTDCTRLKFRHLSEGEIQRYIKKDQPLDCAGSFKIESLGISLFEDIESKDFTAIQGLPLLELSKRLRELNLFIP